VGETGALPVPNYDELTLASLRARLRGLDATQLRVMIDYERANAGREAVLTMFERRVAKLESGEA
jgi:3-deoxy-D-arabino-heptulosonate 7-phosphate (DAHP) synthase